MSPHVRSRPWAIGLIALLSLGMIAVAACGNDDDGDSQNGSNEDDPAATVGDLEIHEPRVRYTFSPNAAGYLRIVNSGEEDRLIGVQTSASERAELHEVIREGETGGRMQEVDGGIVVPANDSVVMETGGYHVMIMGLERELEHGETVEIELEFERAGTVTVTAVVEVLGGGGGDNGHGHHDDDAEDTSEH